MTDPKPDATLPTTAAGRALLSQWLGALLPASLDEADIRGYILAIEEAEARDAAMRKAEWLNEAGKEADAAFLRVYLRKAITEKGNEK